MGRARTARGSLGRSRLGASAIASRGPAELAMRPAHGGSAPPYVRAGAERDRRTARQVRELDPWVAPSRARRASPRAHRPRSNSCHGSAPPQSRGRARVCGVNRPTVEFMDSTAASIFAELDGSSRGWSLDAAVCARDAALRSRAVAALRSDGVDVCTATSGPAELLAELTRYHADCVVCIASGADGDGDIACAQALRSRPSGSHLVVVS